jgi:hypothetical protein
MVEIFSRNVLRLWRMIPLSASDTGDEISCKNAYVRTYRDILTMTAGMDSLRGVDWPR